MQQPVQLKEETGATAHMEEAGVKHLHVLPILVRLQSHGIAKQIQNVAVHLPIGAAVGVKVTHVQHVRVDKNGIAETRQHVLA